MKSTKKTPKTKRAQRTKNSPAGRKKRVTMVHRTLLTPSTETEQKGRAGQTLLVQLGQIEQTGLIQQADPEPDPAYKFKHALIQESAYGSLLHRAQREIHRYVAETYENLYGSQLDEYAALLAQHYGEAGDDAKTLVYALRAAERASRMHANAEALLHYSRALELADKTSAGASTVQDIFSRRGRTLELMGKYADALENYEAMEAWARRHRNASMELASLIPRAIMHSIPTAQIDFQHAQVFIERALTLAAQLNDYPAQARVYWTRMLLNSFSGHSEQAIADGEKSIVLARKFDSREQLAYSLNDLTRPLFASGNFDRAAASLVEAQSLWRELGNQPMLADNLTTLAIGAFLTRRPGEAVALAQEASEISRSIGNPWGISFSEETLGYAYFDQGLIGDAIAALEESIRFGEQAGFLDPQVNGRALLAFGLAQSGEVERAEQIAEEALKCVELHKIEGDSAPRAAIAYLQILRGDYDLAAQSLAAVPVQTQGGQNPADHWAVYANIQLALARQEYAQVIQLVDKSLETLTLLQFAVPELLTCKAQALAALSKSEEAFAVLERAASMAEEGGARRHLWTIFAQLAKLERTLGNVSEAGKWRARAREEVQFLAEHCPDDVRPKFLKLPAVQAIWEDES